MTGRRTAEHCWTPGLLGPSTSATPVRFADGRRTASRPRASPPSSRSARTPCCTAHGPRSLADAPHRGRAVSPWRAAPRTGREAAHLRRRPGRRRLRPRRRPSTGPPAFAGRPRRGPAAHLRLPAQPPLARRPAPGHRRRRRPAHRPRPAAGAPAADAASLLDLVRTQVAAVLGHAPAGRVEPGRGLQGAGLRLADRGRAAQPARPRRPGCALPATLVFDHPTPAALAEHLRDRADRRPPTRRRAPRPAAAAAADEPIAIVGMGCRLPRRRRLARGAVASWSPTAATRSPSSPPTGAGT